MESANELGGTLMASRINKTKSNLQTVWEHLDSACGSLENALQNISLMKNIPNNIKDTAEGIYVSDIVVLKNLIEELLDEKNEV